jgi:hypothetical protein
MLSNRRAAEARRKEAAAETRKMRSLEKNEQLSLKDDKWTSILKNIELVISDDAKTYRSDPLKSIL